MDTDDIAKPDRFEKQLAIFLEHPEIDVSGGLDRWSLKGRYANVLSMRKVAGQHENNLEVCQGYGVR